MPVGRTAFPTPFRERYANWLALVLRRHPDVKRPLLNSIDAYETCRRRKKITRAMLAPITAAAASDRAALWGSATDFLRELTSVHREACRVVEELAASPSEKARSNAVLSVGRDAPRDFRISVLRELISDRSASVRWRAAESAALVHGLYELLPDLEQALSVEKNAKTKRTLADAVQAMREATRPPA